MLGLRSTAFGRTGRGRRRAGQSHEHFLEAASPTSAARATELLTTVSARTASPLLLTRTPAGLRASSRPAAPTRLLLESLDGLAQIAVREPRVPIDLSQGARHADSIIS